MRKMILGGLTLLFSLSLCLSMPMSGIQRPTLPEPDVFRNISELIRTKGYPVEEHQVVTPDGYILGVFRIPHGRNSASSNPGRPVLLQHGLLDSGTTWVINMPEQSLGFILADAGYDVWIGNVRGNVYSRRHTKYNPDHDDEFWDFSYDEMANVDFPAMVSYILGATQQTKISYVGHSQGTMMGFAQFSNPDSLVERNISFWVALAPVAHLGHIESPIKLLSKGKIPEEIERYWHLLFGRNEFLPADSITEWLASIACAAVIVDKEICQNIFFVLFGPEKKNLNDTRMPVYVSHVPSGTSVKNLIHFAQGCSFNIFEAYDYGSPEKNQQHYHQPTPPQYPIRPMTVPTAMFSGGNDWLADPTDVNYIYDNIQPQTLVFRKFLADYNHMDFVWAETANADVYVDLLEQMKKYHPPN